MVNKVTLVGYLGADPRLRRLENGAALASLSLATSEAYKDGEGQWKEQTEWHALVLWRQLAERAEQQLRKGMLVYVEGKLNTRTFTDRNGVDQRRTEVVVNYLRILDRREAGGAGADGAGADGGSRSTGQGSPHTTAVDTPAAATPAASEKPSITLQPGPPADNTSDESGLPF